MYGMINVVPGPDCLGRCSAYVKCPACRLSVEDEKRVVVVGHWWDSDLRPRRR